MLCLHPLSRTIASYSLSVGHRFESRHKMSHPWPRCKLRFSWTKLSSAREFCSAWVLCNACRGRHDNNRRKLKSKKAHDEKGWLAVRIYRAHQVARQRSCSIHIQLDLERLKWWVWQGFSVLAATNIDRHDDFDGRRQSIDTINSTISPSKTRPRVQSSPESIRSWRC